MLFEPEMQAILQSGKGGDKRDIDLPVEFEHPMGEELVVREDVRRGIMWGIVQQDLPALLEEL